MTISMIEFVRRRLETTDETYRELEAGSGVPKSVIQRIAAGADDPRYRHIQGLYDYFRREEVA